MISLDIAFNVAMNNAKHSDVVLFSPGSSSLDQFNGFEDRGNQFVKCVADYVETSLV